MNLQTIDTYSHLVRSALHAYPSPSVYSCKDSHLSPETLAQNLRIAFNALHSDPSNRTFIHGTPLDAEWSLFYFTWPKIVIKPNTFSHSIEFTQRTRRPSNTPAMKPLDYDPLPIKLRPEHRIIDPSLFEETGKTPPLTITATTTTTSPEPPITVDLPYLLNLLSTHSLPLDVHDTIPPDVIAAFESARPDLAIVSLPSGYFKII